MRKWGAWGAVVAVALVLGSHAGTIAQTVTQQFNKILVRSTASDAISTLGGVAVNSGSGITVTSTTPQYWFSETGAGTDERAYRWLADNQSIYLQLANDAGSVFNDAIRVSRSGAAVAGIYLGTGATPFVKMLSATATWDPNNLQVDGGFDSVLVTMTGVTSGSPCFASFTAALSTDIVLSARYDTTNTVRAILMNPNTGGAYDPGSGTVRVTCFLY